MMTSSAPFYAILMRLWHGRREMVRVYPFPPITAANDREEIEIANALDGGGVFELQQSEKLFIPFGEYPHAKGLQKFDAQSGEFLVAAFNSLPAKLGRIFTPGVPIYRGHPDVPGRPDSNPAAPAVGWVSGIEVANDGVQLAVKWGPDGEAAISGAQFRFYSPNWLLRPVKGGIQPVKLLSVGLTNNPRIPVPAIANDNQPNEPMNPDLLKLLGFAENAAPTAAEIATAITAHNDRLTAATAAAEAATAQQTAFAAQLADVTAQVTAANARATAANDAASSARTRFIDARLTGLVEATRVLPAEREELRAELLAIANDDDLDARLATLAATAPKLKTEAVTKHLGKDKSALKQAENDEAARSGRRRDAIAAELTAIANDTTKAAMSESAKYDLGFARAAAKNPTLFPTKTTTV